MLCLKKDTNACCGFLTPASPSFNAEDDKAAAAGPEQLGVSPVNVSLPLPVRPDTRVTLAQHWQGTCP